MPRVAAAALAVVALLLIASSFVSAQTPEPTTLPFASPTPTPQPDATPRIPKVTSTPRPLPTTDRVGVDNSNPLSLRLDEAIELALKNNNNLDVSRNDVQINTYNWRAALGIYDPVINSQTYYESRSTPTASTIGGAVNGTVVQKTIYSDAGVSGLVPWGGGSYNVLLNGSRLTTSNRNATLNPQYPSSLVASFTQPLWRNRSIDINRRNILVASRNIDLSAAVLRQTAMDTIDQVEQAYWNLTFALRNLQVQIDTLKQAREQLESNQRQVNVGVLAPIEIVAATAQITTFEQGVYTAQENVTRAENTLKTLLLPDRTSPEWSQPLMPTTPIDQPVPQIGLEVALSQAMSNRPELEQLAINQEINDIDLRYYRNQAKPEINLVNSYTSQGLAGTQNPNASGSATVPTNLVGGLFGSFTNLLQQDYPTYRTGIQISIPLRNRTAKANVGRTLVQADRIQNQRDQEEQIVEQDVRNALQALRSNQSRLDAAVANRLAAEELYNSEVRQFRAGTSTFFLVAQRQTELLTARSNELQARTNLNIAISTFERATGTSLSANNVVVSTPTPNK